VGLLGLSASAVGKHVVCWVASSLAVGFLGLLAVLCMLVCFAFWLLCLFKGACSL
jgi:hypothetical protein